MFDIEKAKKESGLTKDILEKIEKGIRAEFPKDEMMFELHLIRVLNALKEGVITIEEAMSEERPILQDR